VNTKGNDWEPVFTVTYLLPVGGIGATKREIKLHIQDTPQTREIAHLMPGMFISSDDMGTPAGAVTLRGAWNLSIVNVFISDLLFPRFAVVTWIAPVANTSK
jgi:hypothetical protein